MTRPLILGLLTIFALPAAAQNYCSLEVRVVNEQGQLLPNVIVEVKEDQRPAHTVPQHDGVVRVCDLGINPVTVSVGLKDCRRVVEEKVLLKWQETVHLTVVTEPEQCNFDGLPQIPLTCTVLFRFETEFGRPIPNVSLSPPVARTNPAVSDDAGRMAVTLADGQSMKTSAVAPGFVPLPIEKTCGRQTYYWREMWVTLQAR